MSSHCLVHARSTYSSFAQNQSSTKKCQNRGWTYTLFAFRPARVRSMQCSTATPDRQHTFSPVETLMGGWAHDITSLHSFWTCWLLGVESWATREKTSLTRAVTLACRLYMTTAHRSPFSRDAARCRRKCPELITSNAFTCLESYKKREPFLRANTRVIPARRIGTRRS